MNSYPPAPAYDLPHMQGAASSDHTTLLLNCYTRVKDVDKLDAFIQQGALDQAAAEGQAEGREGGSSGGLGRGQLPFDVDTAIKVLRSAGYHEHALYVALAAEEPQTYLDILLEDCQRCVCLCVHIPCTFLHIPTGLWVGVSACIPSAIWLASLAVQVQAPVGLGEVGMTNLYLPDRPS